MTIARSPSAAADWTQRLGVWAIAERFPHQPAVLTSPSTDVVTFAELAGRAHQVVHAMRAAGVVAGDTVAIALPNDIDIVVWQLAGSEAGWRYFTLGPNLPAAELMDIFRHSSVKGFVTHAANAAQSSQALGPQVRVSVGGHIDGFVEQSELLAGQPHTLPDGRSAGVLMVYTSGTTGKKKAIEHPLPTAGPDEIADAGKVFGRAFAYEPLKGAHLVSAGMHHGGGRAFYMAALNVGQGLVIMPKFDPEQALKLIDRFSVTTAYMVPTQFVRLLRLPHDVRHRYDLSSLQTVVHSAAPCPRDIKQQMMDWWGPVIWETYGGTEGAATIAKPWRWLEKPGTVGRAIKGVRVHILDEDGNDVPAGVVGEIYVESEGPGFSYYRDADETAQSYRGKRFTIGDLGYLDEDGYLFVADRKKDMLISGGVNVYPAEVEGVLLTHPSVADVAVIGVPDPEWGETVCALIQLTPDAVPSDELANDLRALTRKQLDSYKTPRIVEFRSELPRTETGKILKRQLREEFLPR